MIRYQSAGNWFEYWDFLDIYPLLLLSEERTDLAKQRNVMANARTYSAWVRTGISSVLAGLAIVNFIGVSETPHLYIVAIGMIFVITGIFIYAVAYVNYKNNMKELNYDQKDKSNTLTFFLIITLAMMTSGVMIFGLLVYLK